MASSGPRKVARESEEVPATVTIRTPWKRYAAHGGAECLAMVSYFRLEGLGSMPKFAWNALRVGLQLGRSDGLLCHSSGARLRSLEFWSVTVWEDERALMRFVRASPHSEIMEEMRPHVRRSEFVRWGIAASDAPPDRRGAEGLLEGRLAAERFRA